MSMLACLVKLFVFVYTVSSGSVTVNADSSVQLLAEEAVPLDQLDVAVSTISTSFHTYIIQQRFVNHGKSWFTVCTNVFRSQLCNFCISEQISLSLEAHPILLF